jgi:isocitrate dehydrogenase
MTAITVAYGDGIGPEIMKASLEILQAAGARLELETIDIGESVYLAGQTSGITPESWESLRRTKVFYKAPITTPQGGGYKSLNVTIRKTLGLYANVRPCASYYPYIETRHPLMNVVIVRENEEDLYAGIEHRQTEEVYQTLKLISQPGTEKIIRYAFEYARNNGRKKVSCFTKDNIMKLTDGLFHKVFDQIAQEYPDIQNEHWIIDIGTAKLADRPEQFDVLVLSNLYGDILSDVAAQLTGSVGLGASANIGEGIAMFEAIHGSAPDIAGRGIANPSGLLLAGVMMLVHLGQSEIAEAVHNAWLSTIEDGIHTGDIFNKRVSKERVDTEGFKRALLSRLGQKPELLRPVTYTQGSTMTEGNGRELVIVPALKELVGVDVFLDWKDQDRSPDVLGALLGQHTAGTGLELSMISNRGLKVWPDSSSGIFYSDHWRCRYIAPAKTPIQHAQIVALLQRIAEAGLDFIKIENLYDFDGAPGYSLSQGE